MPIINRWQRAQMFNFSTNSDRDPHCCSWRWHSYALEFPGKMRLTRRIAMQSIYYPGFTIGGGIGEFGGNCNPHPVVLYTFGGVQNWLALLGLVGMQAVYWL